MVVGQLGKLTGTSVEGDNVVAQVRSFSMVVDDAHLLTLAVGTGTLGVVLAIQFLRPAWPATLIGVAAATVLCVLADLQDHGVAVVGRNPDRTADAGPSRRDVGGVPDAAARRAGNCGDRLQRHDVDCPRLSAPVDEGDPVSTRPSTLTKSSPPWPECMSLRA